MLSKQNMVAFTMLIFLLSISSICLIAEETEAKEPVIKYGYIHNDHQAPLYIAIMKWEHFKDKYDTYLKPVSTSDMTKCELWSDGNKLADVDLVRTRGGSAFTTLMGQGHFGIGSGGVPAMLFAIDKGMDAKILSPMMTEGDALVVKPDLKINSWDEFVKFVKHNDKKPFRVGYKVPVAVAKTVFEGAMKEERISYSEDASRSDVDILLVNMKGNKNIIPGLQRGVIDACVTNMPVPAIAQGKGVGKIVTYLASLPPKGKWVDHPCCCVAASDEMIKNHPEITAKLVQVMANATEWMGANGQEMPSLCSAWLGTSEKDERLSLDCIKFVVAPNETWKSGVWDYVDLMQNLGEINGRLKGKNKKEIESLVFDFRPYEKAMVNTVAKD